MERASRLSEAKYIKECEFLAKKIFDEFMDMMGHQ
jgi:hypothetical protein